MIFAQKQPSSGASGSSSCKNVYHVQRSHSVFKCFYHPMFKEGDCYMSSCTTKFLHNTSPSVEWKNKYIQINKRPGRLQGILVSTVAFKAHKNGFAQSL